MDVAIPIMLDSELATDVVKLLGEKLKGTKAKLRVAEEELERARQAQEQLKSLDEKYEGCCAVNMLPAMHLLLSLPDGQLSGREMVAHVSSALQALRDDLQAERAQAAKRNNLVAELQGQLKELVEEREHIVKEKQHAIEIDAQLNTQVAELRKRLRSRDDELAQKAEMVATLQDKLTEKDGELRSCAEAAKEKQNTITTLTETKTRSDKEVEEVREAASAKDEELEKTEEEVRTLKERLKKNRDVMRAIAAQRDQARAAARELEDKFKAHSELCGTMSMERDQYKAALENCKADAKKAEQQMVAKRYDWIPEYSAFIAMMQGLPEPTDALPPRDKLRQFLKAERVGPTPRVVEVTNELYGDDCVLYLSESTLWASASRHGIAIVPLYNYIANVDPQRPKWTPATLRDDVHEQLRELFYRDSNGFVVYAGTYKFVKGPEMHGVTVPDHGRLNLNSSVMKMLARRTLGSSERNEAVFNMVFAGYVQGFLPFGMIALQCVGYKEGFDDALQAWSAQFARRSSDGGQPSLGVAVKAEPKTVPAPPSKRKCETEAATEAPADPRKRKKTGIELVIEPVASAVARPPKNALKAKAAKAAAKAVKREQ